MEMVAVGRGIRSQDGRAGIYRGSWVLGKGQGLGGGKRIRGAVAWSLSQSCIGPGWEPECLQRKEEQTFKQI